MQRSVLSTPGESYKRLGQLFLITRSYNHLRTTMPIDIERFESSPEDELTAQPERVTNAELILEFLTAESDKAFTPKEIREETGIPRGSVGVVLSRLEENGQVRHRGEYWAIADEDRGEKVLTTVRTARAATERFGPEDPDNWGTSNSADQS